MPWKSKTRRGEPTPYPAFGVAEVRGDWTLSPDRRDELFGRLRPLLSPGRGRIIVAPGRIAVEQVPADLLTVVERVLTTIARDLGPRPAQRRDVA
jgi:hypothetical protein